jgi:hypothetical protein
VPQTTLTGEPETTLVNVRHREHDREDVAMIDRGTEFGNPYKTVSDGGEYTRQEAINLFEGWWYRDEQADLRAQATEELTGETIGCWCVDEPVTAPEKPFECHGEIILEYLLHGNE